MSGFGSDDTFVGCVFDVRNDVKLDTVSPAVITIVSLSDNNFAAWTLKVAFASASIAACTL